PKTRPRSRPHRFHPPLAGLVGSALGRGNRFSPALAGGTLGRKHACIVGLSLVGKAGLWTLGRRSCSRKPSGNLSSVSLASKLQASKLTRPGATSARPSSFPFRCVADKASGAEQLVEQWLLWRTRAFKFFLPGPAMGVGSFLRRKSAVRLHASGDCGG